MDVLTRRYSGKRSCRCSRMTVMASGMLAYARHQSPSFSTRSFAKGDHFLVELMFWHLWGQKILHEIPEVIEIGPSLQKSDPFAQKFFGINFTRDLYSEAFSVLSEVIEIRN
eukprot:scaffold12054_cov112-Skeletonema_dohrnii-CCMP3373.AAC.2